MVGMQGMWQFYNTRGSTLTQTKTHSESGRQHWHFSIVVHMTAAESVAAWTITSLTVTTGIQCTHKGRGSLCNTAFIEILKVKGHWWPANNGYQKSNPSESIMIDLAYFLINQETRESDNNEYLTTKCMNTLLYGAEQFLEYSAQTYIIVCLPQWDSGAQYYTTEGIRVQSYRIIYTVPLDLLHPLRMLYLKLSFLPGRQSSSEGAGMRRHRSTQTQRQSESAASNKYCAPSAQGLLPKISWTAWMFALLLA